MQVHRQLHPKPNESFFNDFLHERAFTSSRCSSNYAPLECVCALPGCPLMSRVFIVQ